MYSVNFIKGKKNETENMLRVLNPIMDWQMNAEYYRCNGPAAFYPQKQKIRLLFKRWVTINEEK